MQFLSRWESQRFSTTTRGIPLVDGLPIEEIARQNWQPSRGDLALPALTLDEAAFAANRDLFLRWCRSAGVAVAPHAKTPMSPELAQSLREAGAWGTTVANIQQAAVLLASGERRLLLANEIGGLAAGRRLGALLGAYPDVEFHAFADSPAAVAALAEAARIAGRSELSVLVELGAGRAGARDRATVEATIAAVLAADGLLLGGVATYEGAVATPDADETMRAIAALMERTIAAFALVRHAAPGRPLIISSGGSAYFDVVARALTPSAQADGNASVLLRSDALFFADHGIYARFRRARPSRRSPHRRRAALGGRGFPACVDTLGRGVVAAGGKPRDSGLRYARCLLRSGIAGAATRLPRRRRTTRACRDLVGHPSQ
ncbi:D-serine deaminase-like pyridoxal phosphate-dependent protein [Bradyrhizobium sp. S3.7.6]